MKGLLVLAVLALTAPAMAATATAATATAVTNPCPGDKSHSRTDSWLCDDKCNTCTCAPDGTVSASGCKADEQAAATKSDPTEKYKETFEKIVVQLAGLWALIVLCGCTCICYMMCVKGGRTNASDLVRELEEADEK